MSLDEKTIDSLIAFHKTLADATRLKLIGLLALRPMCGLELARELKVSAPTVSHHINKLKELNLVRSAREDNTIYYSLDADRLHELSRLNLGGAAAEPSDEAKHNSPPTRDDRQKVLANFFVDGRLKAMPAQQKRQLYILEEFAKDFEHQRDYSEKEVNEVILRRYDDYCLIRRDLVIFGYMTRDRGTYRLRPRDQWPTAE